MKVQNSEVTQIFNQVADLLDIQGANPFRTRAYRYAARTIQGMTENVADLISEHKDLSELPGIGKDLAGKIEEIVSTGHLALLDSTAKKVPMGLLELLKIPNLGPKKVQLLNKKLGVDSIESLQNVIDDKSIFELKGFGEKSITALTEELRKLKQRGKFRFKLAEVEATANDLLAFLKKAPAITKVTVAGSYRRKKETVADLDIVATSKSQMGVMEHFLKFDSIAKVISQGVTKSSIVLTSGIQVDLRCVPEVSYGAALLYFTGSKAHNIALRKMAGKRGLKINEYGIFKGERRIASRNEADLYKALALPYIEPELRENQGEIEAALQRKLPSLITIDDIRGDLHVHTKLTDGRNSIIELVRAAQKLNYSYIAITDHSKQVAIAHGLDKKRLFKQLDEIDRINSDLKNFTVLKSIEVDILEDGTLDLPNEVLARLDLTVCAIHSHFHLTREKQTQRVLKAIENPYFSILAHPTGRIIDSRAPMEMDFERIFLACKEMNRILEINCQPERMDLSDIYCRMAKDIGVRMALSTDAHSIFQMNYMKNGIGLARRGWLEKSDVINALTLKELKKILNKDTGLQRVSYSDLSIGASRYGA